MMANEKPEDREHDLLVEPTRQEELREDANTQITLVRAKGLLGFQHSKSPTGIAQSLENALIALAAMISFTTRSS